MKKNPEYSNMRKIKVSTRFCFDLMDQYEADKYQKAVSEKNKKYFDGL